ncbi:hypothetical protein SAMN04487777_13212 [Priestia aryabhattai B8W22]|uniref:hypothetical protein n=1 Tax=Priestia aryabhattai TaxID=412384 RepID=UPI0008800D7C|nr:hypothetical protein SAMN04487777_13212 [Priestia aryabhattai B8W22]
MKNTNRNENVLGLGHLATGFYGGGPEKRYDYFYFFDPKRLMTNFTTDPVHFNFEINHDWEVCVMIYIIHSPANPEIKYSELLTMPPVELGAERGNYHRNQYSYLAYRLPFRFFLVTCWYKEGAPDGTKPWREAFIEEKKDEPNAQGFKEIKFYHKMETATLATVYYKTCPDYC